MPHLMHLLQLSDFEAEGLKFVLQCLGGWVLGGGRRVEGGWRGGWGVEGG